MEYGKMDEFCKGSAYEDMGLSEHDECREEIARLEADNERLREALVKIRDMPEIIPEADIRFTEVARKALKGGE